MAADPTKVREILIVAREVVDSADLPEELQIVAFEKAVELLAGRAPATTPGESALPVPLAGEPKTLDAVAAKLKLSLEGIGEVFHVEGTTSH